MHHIDCFSFAERNGASLSRLRMYKTRAIRSPGVYPVSMVILVPTCTLGIRFKDHFTRSAPLFCKRFVAASLRRQTDKC